MVRAVARFTGFNIFLGSWSWGWRPRLYAVARSGGLLKHNFVDLLNVTSVLYFPTPFLSKGPVTRLFHPNH